MAIDQGLLLWASSLYRESENQEYLSHGRLRPIPKVRVFVSHVTEAFRMVEGFVVLMRCSGIDAYFDWNSLYMTDEERSEGSLSVDARIAKADVFVFLATEGSVHSKECLRQLEYAESVKRTIYIVNTKTKNTFWSINTQTRYDELSVELQSRFSGRFKVRVREKSRNNLWVPISSSRQL